MTFPPPAISKHPPAAPPALTCNTFAWQALAHKLAPPAPLEGQVVRTALCERVLKARGQLVLLTAPAGFGKTTALRQVREALLQQGETCLWLTLDSADNDRSRLTTGLQAAAHRAGLPLAHDASDDVLAAFLSTQTPWSLLLDEAETLTDEGSLSLLRELAMQLPAHARLVVAARKPPAIGLARLRVRGRLTEIDSELLRFQPEEVTALFAARPDAEQPSLKPALDCRQIDALWRKTEGWPAAIALAQLALARSPNPADLVARFSGSDRAVAEYLSEDVLDGLAPELQRFLLRTSILRHLDASICSALNPQANSAELLRQLDEQRLFVTPVEGPSPAWRYHSLFADYLRNQLQQCHPEEVTRLHLAASSWYESHERPVPAIEHAIEGGDLPHALSLMAGHAEALLEQGRMRLLTRWFAALPETMVQTHPRLEAVAIWAMSLTQGPWAAMARLERSAHVLGTPSLKAHARSLRTMLLAMQDRYDEALLSGNQALPALPTGEAFADTTLLNAMAHVTSVFFGEHQVRPLLDASRAQQLPASRFNRMYSEAIVGMLDLMQGRLSMATDRFRLGLRSAPMHTQPLGHGNAWAGLLYAYSLYEANDWPAAQHQLNVYLPMARETGLPDHVILGHSMQARMAQWQGDMDTAHQSLNELEALGHERQLERLVAAAQLERAHLALLRQHSAQAKSHLLAARNDALWTRERRQFLLANETQYLRLAELRWHIAFGTAMQRAEADQALAQEMHLALQAGRQRRLLVLKLLRCAVMERLGQWDNAKPLLQKTLQQAAGEGHYRLILDEGWPVLAALKRFYCEINTIPQSTTVSIQHFLSTVLQELQMRWSPDWDEVSAATDSSTAVPPPHSSAKPPSEANAAIAPEALTQREQQVLHLLVEGYSNSAMAEKLFLSDSTVRTHLRSINQKLGARSRTHAVALARKLGLVH